MVPGGWYNTRREGKVKRTVAWESLGKVMTILQPEIHRYFLYSPTSQFMGVLSNTVQEVYRGGICEQFCKGASRLSVGKGTVLIFNFKPYNLECLLNIRLLFFFFT